MALVAENRPAVYRMIDPRGRTIYVGKAKRLRTRLLSYFRARYPADKASRILHAAADIEWQYVPSEFAALLGELRDIQRHRPIFNVKLNRVRRSAFISVTGGPAPKLAWGSRPPGGGTRVRCYGPFSSRDRVAEGVRTLNDLLGLRDCAINMPMVFAEQGDLFGGRHHAACLRHELGACTGPCAGYVAAAEYQDRVETAVAFLEGRSIEPIDRVVAAMQQAGRDQAFEQAARWRDRFEALEWLFAAANQARAGIDLLSFVYHDPGMYGDDRAYLIRQGQVRASFPDPKTPIEIEAFRAVVRTEVTRPTTVRGPLPRDGLDEILLITAWFRQHPDALRRTTSLEHWLNAD